MSDDVPHPLKDVAAMVSQQPQVKTVGDTRRREDVVATQQQPNPHKSKPKKRPRQAGFHARHLARQRVVQALYQWQMTQQSITLIEQQFLAEQPMDKVDVPYFRELFRLIPKHIAELDQLIDPVLDRPLSQLDVVERGILWLTGYELTQRNDVPWKVIINEGIELAKEMGATDSHKYINGILDKLVQQQRTRKHSGDIQSAKPESKEE